MMHSFCVKCGISCVRACVGWLLCMLFVYRRQKSRLESQHSRGAFVLPFHTFRPHLRFLSWRLNNRNCVRMCLFPVKAEAFSRLYSCRCSKGWHRRRMQQVKNVSRGGGIHSTLTHYMWIWFYSKIVKCSHMLKITFILLRIACPKMSICIVIGVLWLDFFIHLTRCVDDVIETCKWCVKVWFLCSRHR